MRDTRGTGAKLAQTCELVEPDVTDSDAVRRTVERVVEDEVRLDAVDEPWPLGDPDEVTRAVVRAIEDESTSFRVLLGDDAAWYVSAKAQGDDEYRRRIWHLWHLLE